VELLDGDRQLDAPEVFIHRSALPASRVRSAGRVLC